jgi:hypothetical protein
MQEHPESLKFSRIALETRNLLLVIIIISSQLLLASPRESQTPDIIRLAAHNQEQAMAVRDRTRYQQELAVERFGLGAQPNSGNGGTKKNSKKLGERTTVVSIEPSPTVDALGRREVLVRIVSDTDDQGNPKPHIDPKGQPGLLVEILWDEMFFPLQEEKLPFLQFEAIPSDDSAVVKYHFEPKVQAKSMILASGLVSIDAATGGVKEIRIQALHNLQSIHKQLAKLESISAEIQYEPFRGTWNLPASATGNGVSHLPHLDGFFQFKFREWGYEPVMEIPEPQDVPF